MPKQIMWAVGVVVKWDKMTTTNLQTGEENPIVNRPDGSVGVLLVYDSEKAAREAYPGRQLIALETEGEPIPRGTHEGDTHESRSP